MGILDFRDLDFKDPRYIFETFLFVLEFSSKDSKGFYFLGHFMELRFLRPYFTGLF